MRAEAPSGRARDRFVRSTATFDSVDGDFHSVDALRFAILGLVAVQARLNAALQQIAEHSEHLSNDSHSAPSGESREPCPPEMAVVLGVVSINRQLERALNQLVSSRTTGSSSTQSTETGSPVKAHQMPASSANGESLLR